MTASYTIIMEEKQESQTAENTKKPAEKKRKTWKKVVGGILTAIFAVILVLCVVLVVQSKVAKKPFLFGRAIYFVMTGSMEPTIMTGDVIIVERVDSPDELKKGDIITYHGKEGSFAGKIVTHRIVSEGVEDGKITTCGDANHGAKDPQITYGEVIGRYVKTSAFLSTLYKVFTSKYGFLLIIVIPLLILLVVQIINFRRACRMDKDGKLPEEKTEEEIKDQAVREREEEIKRKAVEEYLASKKRIEKAERASKNKK